VFCACAHDLELMLEDGRFLLPFTFQHLSS
jgi:hypothetical protein